MAAFQAAFKLAAVVEVAGLSDLSPTLSTEMETLMSPEALASSGLVEASQKTERGAGVFDWIHSR